MTPPPDPAMITPFDQGRELLRQGQREAAVACFRQAVAQKPDFPSAWVALASTLHELHRSGEAVTALDHAIVANPDVEGLLEAKAMILRWSGDLKRTEAWLRELVRRRPDRAWVHFHLGDVLTTRDRSQANDHLRRAVDLEPEHLDHLMALIQSLERTHGAEEGANTDEAFELCGKAMALGVTKAAHKLVISNILTRVCAYDELEALGSFEELGRGWAQAGLQGALFKQLARVRGPQDRLELLEQHRIWGRAAQDRARRSPLRPSPPRPQGGRIRLGLMSSDLRRHSVGHFVVPLFDHLDRDRFELFAYSFFAGEEDDMQRSFAERASTFRWLRDTPVRQAAQVIADDGLDMLIELGGLTEMNKPEVLAFRPAPRQASWLGYPHSVGLADIDYFIGDPLSLPPDSRLLLEAPAAMPRTWVAPGDGVFSDSHAIAPTLPQDRNGFITYGTANNLHKYSRELLHTWAKVVRATPDARFAFIRPEGASAHCRRHIAAEFAAEGVSADRLVWHAVRGRHMPLYNEVDVSLDTFPLTGGTTTAEALWMGVPVVTLVGEAFFERLSYSLLSNAGLGDLCATTPEQFVEIARTLAGDRQRRLDLRQTLRADLKRGPLGQTEAFARDFYELVGRLVARPARV